MNRKTDESSMLISTKGKELSMKNRFLRRIVSILILSFVTIQATACNREAGVNGPTPGTESTPTVALSAGDKTTPNTSSPGETATGTPTVTSAPDTSETVPPAEVTPLPPDPLAPPQFSAEGGFYDELFNLTLSSAPGNTMY